ncbi:MAG: DoxX family protein, partial [bacterium]
LMMAFGHGLGKLTTFSERAAGFADPFGFGSTLSLSFAVFAEFFCSLLLVLGLFTRAIVIPLMITMAVAFLIIHAADPFGRKELALLYFTTYATIFFAGPGKYALDRLFARR